MVTQFLRYQKAFLLTTAAQNIHISPRKSPLCRSHFFEWLKTAISSNACGMSTLKNLLPQAFAVSDVHPRPRKRLARCTLDCGFKTLESPALRGFVGGLRSLATAALYLVLLSNGPHRSKIQLIKFGFSPINTPANIAKKLPLQCCSKPLLIPFFNFLHKRPTFAFTSESGRTHSALGERLHTTAHTAKRGPSLPRPQHGLVPSAKFLLVLHAFIYIHFPVHCEPSTPAEEKNLSKLPPQTLSQTIFHRVFQLLPQTAHVCFHSRKRVHTRLRQQDRTQRHTQRNRGRFGRGRYHYPRHELHIHEHPRAGCQNGKLCRF